MAIIGLLSAIIGTLGPVLAGLLRWLQQSHDEAVGAQLQAGATSAQSATINAAIAQAVVNAPKTQAGVVASLNAGTF